VDARRVDKITSDGGSTAYYFLPEGAKELLDLIEHKKMTFGIGNIFKACYRFGEKSGTDKAYDLRKIILFAQRELAMVEKEQQSTKMQLLALVKDGPQHAAVTYGSRGPGI
jgi:hypothetical protein